MINVLYVIFSAYAALWLVLFTLSRFAVYESRKEGEKRYDALGREY
jgi:hypothetical protein